MSVDFSMLLLDESPDAVIATSPEGKVLFLYWSKGAEAIFGFTSAEALGCSGEEMRRDRVDEERGLLRQSLEKRPPPTSPRAPSQIADVRRH